MSRNPLMDHKANLNGDLFKETASERCSEWSMVACMWLVMIGTGLVFLSCGIGLLAGAIWLCRLAVG